MAVLWRYYCYYVIFAVILAVLCKIVRYSLKIVKMSRLHGWTLYRGCAWQGYGLNPCPNMAVMATFGQKCLKVSPFNFGHVVKSAMLTPD